MLEKIPILITGVGGGGHGHELVKALHLADRYYLIGVDMSPASFGFSDVDEAYVVPPASNPTYLDTLLNICRQKNIQVLLHGSEPELKVLSQCREQIQRAGILPLFNTQEVIDIGMNKFATMKFLTDHGFTMPNSLMIQHEADIPSDFPLPAVVKPAVGGGGSNNTFVVQEFNELTFACQYVLKQGQIVLLQEYVGTPDDEYTVGVLHTLDGVLVDSIAVRRHIMSGLSNRIKVPNRTGREELSPILAISSGISQGIVDEFSEVRQACEAIAAAIGSKGPINIQCRFVSGVLYPFEINPRFSGTSFIRAMLGFNEPDLLIRHHLLGERLPEKIQYKFGQVVRGLAERDVDALPPIQRWA